MKTQRISILTLGILVAIFSLLSCEVFAEGKETKKEARQLKKIEQEAVNQIQEIESLDKIEINHEVTVRIVDQNEKIIYEGNCVDKKAKVLKLTSNFLIQIDGVCYYQSIQ